MTRSSIGAMLDPMRALFILLLSLWSCRSPPEVVGGCRYEMKQGTCSLASAESEPTNSNMVDAVDVKLVYQWTGELPPQFHDKTTIVRWTVPQDRAEEALAHAKSHAEVSCIIGINVGGSCPPDGPRIDPPDALPRPDFARP